MYGVACTIELSTESNFNTLLHFFFPCRLISTRPAIVCAHTFVQLNCLLGDISTLSCPFFCACRFFSARPSMDGVGMSTTQTISLPAPCLADHDWCSLYCKLHVHNEASNTKLLSVVVHCSLIAAQLIVNSKSFMHSIFLQCVVCS